MGFQIWGKVWDTVCAHDNEVKAMQDTTGFALTSQPCYYRVTGTEANLITTEIS